MSAIDVTKPEPGDYLDSSVIRQLATVAKQEIEELQTRHAYDLPINVEVVGTTPKLITSLLINAGTYTRLSAFFGCIDAADTAIIELCKTDGAVLALISRTGYPEVCTASSFNLPSESLIHFYIVANSSTATAICTGIQLG